MAVWTATTPASEPLTLNEVKNYLRIASVVTADDDYITALIIEARQYVERVTARALITQDVTEYFDSFPLPNSLTPRIISLHIAPVASIAVDGISYIADDGTPVSYTTWDNTGDLKYFLDSRSGKNGIGPARISKKFGVDWPVIEDYPNAVKISYTAGYGSDVEDIPRPLIRAMYKLISRWYYNPDEKDDFALVADLLNPYKVHK